MSTFTDLGVSRAVCSALARRNIAQPFDIQRLVIGDALEGRDVLAKSRTGSGKTLAFAIPIVERVEADDKRPAALVLVPTRELAEQVMNEMRDVAAARNLRVAAVYGGVPIPKQAQRAAKAHVVIATPGRLTDLVDRRLLSLEAVRILVLDEADRMLDMGFQPQVNRIVNGLTRERQTMFFSATLEGVVGHVAGAYTHDAVRHEVRERRVALEDAEHRFVKVDEHVKLDRLVEILEGERGLALVFVRTKRGADRLRSRLSAKGVRALALHGDMNQAARTRAVERFESGRIDLLVATDVAARGLDLDDITHVINYDPPQSDKDYVHRIGRTARAGRTGTAVTLVGPLQQQEVGTIARRLKLKEEYQADGLTLAPPRPMYSSHRSRSSMRPRRRRRF